MATSDNGLVLAAYGPSEVEAMVGNGEKVVISEETEYPFRGIVTLTIKTEKPVKFPLYLRIPGWGRATVRYGESELVGEGGNTLKLKKKWKNGDKVIINIPLELRFERRFNNSISVLRGPLYFSLRIEKEFKSIKLNYDNFGYMGSVDWAIYPGSDWNYGVLTDLNNPGNGYIVDEHPLTRYPFADRGDMVWSADSGKYYTWRSDPPISIRTRGFKIPGWTIKNNSADVPPTSPLKSETEPEEITLVPYGAARLRITEFPVMDIIIMEQMNPK
jgi:hypothetical protein